MLLLLDVAVVDLKLPLLDVAAVGMICVILLLLDVTAEVFMVGANFLFVPVHVLIEVLG